MEPEMILDSISKELGNALKEMSKAKTVEEKVAYSKIVKNLSESLGVFINFAAEDMGDYDEDFDLNENEELSIVFHLSGFVLLSSVRSRPIEFADCRIPQHRRFPAGSLAVGLSLCEKCF